MKNLISLFAIFLLPVAGFAQTYHEADKATLRAFLSQSKKNMTRLMAILFAVLGTFAANAQGSLSGTGTEFDPYLISNAADLDDMRNYLLGGSKGKYFRLTADIDLTEYIATGQGTASSTEGWLPIDNDTTSSQDIVNSFQGNLNGAGHKITGLWINQSITSPYEAVGLFESIYNESSIDSLGIEIASRGVKGTKNNSPVGGMVLLRSPARRCASRLLSPVGTSMQSGKFAKARAIHTSFRLDCFVPRRDEGGKHHSDNKRNKKENNEKEHFIFGNRGAAIMGHRDYKCIRTGQ